MDISFILKFVKNLIFRFVITIMREFNTLLNYLKFSEVLKAVSDNFQDAFFLEE